MQDIYVLLSLFVQCFTAVWHALVAVVFGEDHDLADRLDWFIYYGSLIFFVLQHVVYIAWLLRTVCNASQDNYFNA